MSDGKFRPGVSGNPRGRPAGSRNRSNVVAAEFAKEGSAVARVVIEKAKEGDMSAASLVLTRISPPLRPQAAKVQFQLDPESPIGEQAKEIIVAVSRGDIDPDTCRLLLDCLSAFVGLRDVEHLLDELKALREKRPPIPGGVVHDQTHSD